MTSITLVNFSHPITDSQFEAIVERLGEPIDRVINVPTHFDQSRSFVDQATELLNQVDIAWETTPLIVNLPSFAPIAAVLLVQLHGLMGHFPTIFRLRPSENAIVTTFELAEIISLDDVRVTMRDMRGN